MRGRVAAAGLAASMLVAVTPSAAATRAERPLISVAAGTVAGVRVGDTAGDIERKLGRPTYGDGFFALRETRFTGPISIPAPDAIQAAVLRYPAHAFLVGSIGAYALKTVAPDAETERGVGVGDALAAARRAYAGARCGRFSSGEGSAFGWCRARVGPNTVFFGGDPIESVTVTRVGRYPRRLTSRVVDVRRGAYRDVALGATRRQVVSRLGTAPRWDASRDPTLPLVRPVRGAALPPFAAIRPLQVLRYPDVAYVLGRGRVYAIVVGGNAGGPRPRGVALMARLSTVRERHPSLRCTVARAGESKLTYPLCSGRVGVRRWLWAAHDPVGAIVLASVRLPARG